jgi:hypothetical protein
VDKQTAPKRAIDAAAWAEARLEKREFEAGSSWTALADTWANIAAQLPEAMRPSVPREKLNDLL